MKAKVTAFSWRRVFFTLHLWLGLASGLLFTLVCATGFFLALHPQLEARARSAAFSHPQAQALAPERIVAQALPHGVPDRIEIPAQAGAPWKLRVEKGHLYVNPQTGQVLEPLGGGSYNWVKKLHRWLLLDSKVGRPITGAAALIYLVMMASGLYLWLEKCYRKPMRGLSFQRGVGWKRTVYDAHLVLGIYALLPLTLMAATGLWWSYREPVKAALYWSLDGTPPPVAKEEKKSKEEEEVPPRTNLPYAELIAIGGQEFAYRGTLRIVPPAQEATEISLVKIREAGFWQLPIRDEVKVDLTTLKVVSRKPFAKKSRAEQFTSLIYDIHTGAAWGDVTLVLFLLATLVGTTLPISGTVMWWNRMRGQQRAKEIMARRRASEKAPRSAAAAASESGSDEATATSR